MKNFIFKTTTTMKPHNCKKWRIDSDIITEKRISAETIAAALDEYRAQVEDRHYIAISNNAMKTKEPMYIDTPTGESKQCGYVITGKIEFQDDFGNWTSQYIDLWVSVLTVIDTDFEEVTA